ncbi:MAG TPA: hypothetical protein VFX24_02555 [Ktedonobacterales bacterium]|jgi:hypothetical protein|nr:hypothetical protein [Ktedonobacterales bacterium]
MTSRSVLTLGYFGLFLFALGAGWLLLGFAFICMLGCPDAANVPENITRGLSYFSRFTLPGLLLLAVAWVGCLALLRRAQLWRSLVVLVAAPLAGIGLAAWNMLRTYNDVAAFSERAPLSTASGEAYYNWSTEMWKGLFPAWSASLWFMALAIFISGVLIIMSGHQLRRVGRPQSASAQGTAPSDA